MADTWHVTLFHHHPDGSATQYAWWVNAQYATDMLAYMGEPDGEALMSIQDVIDSIDASAKVPMLTREESPDG